MKTKIVIISLLSIALVSIVTFSLITNKDNNIEQNENETTLIDDNIEEEILIQDNKLPEIKFEFNDDSNILEFGEDEEQSSEDDFNSENLNGNIPTLTDDDLKEKNEKDYITIGDDERISIDDNGKISISLTDNENKTELIFE